MEHFQQDLFTYQMLIQSMVETTDYQLLTDKKILQILRQLNGLEINI